MVSSDTRLATDMARAMGKAIVRTGVDMLLGSNHTAANEQAPLIRCRACDGAAVIEVKDGDAGLEDLAGHPYWGKDRAETNSNGKEAKVRPTASNGRGPSPYVTIGETLHTYLKSLGLTSGHEWVALAEKTKQGYEVAADYFLDNVVYSGREAVPDTEGLRDELGAARDQLDRVKKALIEAGAPQNCDMATAIQRLAEAHRECVKEHERIHENADKGFDNILAALKESGAVIDYSNPLQAAKDLVLDFKALTEMHRKMDESMRDIRDEIAEAIDITDMETASGAKRLAQLYIQQAANMADVRRDAMINTMKQFKSYIEATMQHVKPQGSA